MITEYKNKSITSTNTGTSTGTDFEALANELKSKTKQGRPIKMTQEQIQEAKELRKHGVSLYTLAKRYNVSHTTIATRVK